jgi:hypothetical protein
MARKIFFSFHYKRDSWRVSVVRNSNVVSSNYDKTRFLDHADWQSIERQGDNAIKNWIDNQLMGSTVTCVLIGTETNSRKWVHYEIEKSIVRKNAILGVFIHYIKNKDGLMDYLGVNPLSKYRINGRELISIAPTYDWVNNNGYINLSSWIEQAVKSFESINHFRGS